MITLKFPGFLPAHAQFEQSVSLDIFLKCLGCHDYQLFVYDICTNCDGTMIEVFLRHAGFVLQVLNGKADFTISFSAPTRSTTSSQAVYIAAVTFSFIYFPCQEHAKINFYSVRHFNYPLPYFCSTHKRIDLHHRRRLVL